MNIPLRVNPPEHIRSWKELYTAAQRLRDDYDNHGYHAFRSSGRKYCACVKVHNRFADVTKSIEKLNVQDLEIEGTLIENFGPNEVESYYNEWISSAAEFLNEWFEGTTHDSDEYYLNVLATIDAGEVTTCAGVADLKGKRAKKAYVKAMMVENALFREALDEVDSDTLVWEGRSSGYITWNCVADLGRTALDLEECAHDALNKNKPMWTFHEALEVFKQTERIHNLNLALIDHVEAWAKTMSFQEELDYLVQQNFEELRGVPGEALPPMEKYGHLEVTIGDSILAGNCASGTANWLRANMPGRMIATISELLAVDDMKSSVRRLCRFVIRRHVAEQASAT